MNITPHQETIYSNKIDLICKCFKIVTFTYCLNRDPVLGNTIGKEKNENSIFYQTETLRSPEEEILVDED